MEVPDDAATKARKARAAAHIAEIPVAGKQSPAQDAATPGIVPPITEAADKNADDTTNEDEQPTGEEEAAEADGNKVEVADKNEAIEYLKEHFSEKNYTATSLRTKTAFDAACAEHGIEFVYTD